MTLHELANQACRDLPEGWIIEIHLERGSGYIDLFNPNGDLIEIPGYDQNSLDTQFIDVLRIARGEHVP